MGADERLQVEDPRLGAHRPGDVGGDAAQRVQQRCVVDLQEPSTSPSAKPTQGLRYREAPRPEFPAGPQAVDVVDRVTAVHLDQAWFPRHATQPGQVVRTVAQHTATGGAQTRFDDDRYRGPVYRRIPSMTVRPPPMGTASGGQVLGRAANGEVR